MKTLLFFLLAISVSTNCYAETHKNRQYQVASSKVYLSNVALSSSVPSSSLSVNCNTVWVNTKTKKYHRQGSFYYGATDHGKYMCLSDAKKQGYHFSFF